MAPKSAAPAVSSSGSSSYASSSGEEEEEEEEVVAPKKPKGSSSAPPDAPKPSSTTTTTSAAAAQAPKLNPSKSPPSSSEDGDEEDDSSSDSGDNRSKSPPPPKQPHPTPKPTTTEASDSGSTDDSDSESDSSDQPAPPRHSARVADPSIKPLASKPMDAPSKPRKSAPAPASDSDKKKPKALEAAPEHESGGQKRQLFQRIWSEEDEIVILRGMVDYHTKKGTVPSSTDMDAFHEFIHKSLRMEVSRTQLADKVRRLKRKYDTAAARGKNPSFAKPHERTAYELSKKIWGPKKILLEDDDAADGDADDDSTRKRQKTKEEHNAPASIAMAADEEDDLAKVKVPYPFLREAVSQMGNVLPTSIAATRGLELLDDTKAMTLEEKYKKLRVSEMKIHLRRMDLTKEVMKTIVDAIEKLG